MDKVKIHISEYKFLYASVAVALLIILIMFFGYRNGYRFTENLLIGKVGNLSLVVSLPQTKIYIDDEEKVITTNDNEAVEIKLTPREHTVIISKDGYYPWKKDIVMQSEGKIIFSPVFVSKNPSGFVISNEDPEFWKLRNEIITNTLPSKNSPQLSVDGQAKMWVKDNAIFVEVAPSTDSGQASTTRKVIQPDPVVRNVSFYKDRNDVVIMSVSSGVYAIETNKEGTQNFLPIYKGISPSFISGDLNYIYVYDGDILMQVEI